MSEKALDVIEIHDEIDIVKARGYARAVAETIGFGIVDQTRIATAVSEIARNAIDHGGGGKMTLCVLIDRRGVEITIVDQGPGIVDVNQAMRNGYSTGGGLGLGLGGAKRLMDEFEIESKIGQGTKVTMRKLFSSR